MKLSILISSFLLLAACSQAEKKTQLPKDADSLLAVWSGRFEADPTNLNVKKNYVEALILHGNKMIKNLDFSKAIDDGAKAFRLDSNNVETRMLYAESLNNNPTRSLTTDVSTAQKLYKSILKKNPTNEKALVGIASTYAQQMDFEKAFQYVNKALRKNPHYRDAYILKGSVYLLLARMNPEKDGKPGKKFMDLTKSSYETAIQQDPNFFEAYQILGSIYQSENNPICVQYYKSAVALKPNEPEVLFSLAYAQQVFDKPSEALVLYRKMIRIDTSYFQALNQIGVIKQHNYNQIDSAIYYYKSAIKSEPRFVEAWHNLGTCYEAKGDITRALQSYGKALKYNPEFTLSRERADILKDAR